MVVILRCCLSSSSSSSSSSVSFIIQRRDDDEKRERERERESNLYKYKREERKQFQSVAYFSVSCCFKQKTRVLLIKFFFRKNLRVSQTTTENNTTPILIENNRFSS